MAVLTPEEEALLATVDLFEAHETWNGAGHGVDPHPVYKRFGDARPVYEGDLLVDELGFATPSIDPSYSPVFTLTRYEDVAAALRQWDTFSSTIHEARLGKAFGRNL